MSTAPSDEPTGSKQLFDELEIPEMAARIMRAAIHLFARKGYSATSVREIVQEAHVTNPMLYYYFDSKEGLFRRLLDVLNSAMEQGVREALAQDVPLKSKVLQIWQIHLEAARSAPEALRFVYAVLFGPSEGRPPHDMFHRRQELMAEITAMFASAIKRGELTVRQGVTPEVLTMRLFAGINQHMMFSLKIMELADAPDIIPMVDLTTMLGPHAAQGQVDFFFYGAGRLRE